MTRHATKVILFALLMFGCGQNLADDSTGQLNLVLALPDGTSVSSVAWQVRSSSNAVVISGTLSTAGSHTPSFIASLPPSTGNTVRMTATTSAGVDCIGVSAPFDVIAGQSVAVAVSIVCGDVQAVPVSGSVAVSGTLVPGDHCPALTSWLIAPQASAAADPIDVTVVATDADAGETVHYLWKAASGSFANATAATTQYTCGATGSQTLTVEVTDDHAPTPCTTRFTFPPITCL